MAKAGITAASNPVAVPRKCPDPEGIPYQQDDLKACEDSREACGMDTDALILNGLYAYEGWRFLHEDEPLEGWIADSIEGKRIFTHLQFAKTGKAIYVYSWDEASEGELRKLKPFLQLVKSLGLQVYAAIHPWEGYQAGVEDLIDFWVMTEYNWLLNYRFDNTQKFSGKYGYPFTDTHGYHVHRAEFLKCYYAGVNVYFNYALNDINGSTFDNHRKMCLIIPTDSGLIETTSGDGFISGIWFMRYAAHVRLLAEEVLRDAAEGSPYRATALDALDALEFIHPKTDPNVMKVELIGWLTKLTEFWAE